ncbi:MAG TPA: hypothetical protein VGY97_02855 [Solirubrobacteraceae bacterium]|nr:hypothetical protein [Solirubrobacteraceae bacterium]
MSLLIVALIAVILAAVVAVVGAPLRSRFSEPADLAQADPARAGPERADPERADPDVARAELEAARDAKYREIRDAELDFRTGKLSEQDYAELDGALRAQAVEILHRLDALSTR